MLTDIKIKNAKHDGVKQFKLTDSNGLSIRINTKGTKTFIFRYKWLGKDQVITIGEYGISSGQYTLTKAREKRDQFIDDLAVGINPKEESTQGATFKMMSDEWFEAAKVNWSRKTEQTNSKRLKYAIVDLGPKEIENVTAQDILKVCRKIEKRGSIDTAKRTRAVIGSVFKYHMLFDPSERVRDSLTVAKPKNHPHLTEKEDIKELLDKIDNYHGSYEARMALKFLSYTFVRARPLREAEWSEIDGDMWRVPEEKEKTKRPLLVPLSTQAQAILEEVRQVNGDQKYIFSSNYRDNYLSSSTLGRILNRMGYLGKHTVHGFRHMASTCLNELEYDGDAIELQLSHAPPGVRGVYNKAKKINYRTKMMQDWADWLDSL
jgi:integrase